MAIDANLFGTAYLDAENFRANAAAFGVGMSLADYPAGNAGDQALSRVLQAASRLIDSHTGLDFSPEPRTEQHLFDFGTRRIKLNNPPVSAVNSFRVVFSPGTNQVFNSSDFYINNQLGYVELTDIAVGFGIITEYLSLGLSDPVAEITYTSYLDVPRPVKLACGYQAGKMINDGFVDKTIAPNFGQLEINGLTVNNKKGYRLKAEDIKASTLDPTAEKLLSQFKKITLR